MRFNIRPGLYFVLVTPFRGGAGSYILSTTLRPATVQLGVNPVDLETGDFNGDGLPDVASANFDSNEIWVVVNGEDVTFSLHLRSTIHEGGRGPNALAVADFNNDNRLDFATANLRSNDVSILLNIGHGQFRVQSIDVSKNPFDIVTEDFDVDGDWDLATTTAFTNEVCVLLGDGRGNFDPCSPYTVGMAPAGIIVADMNGDGHLDLATANLASNDVSILLGNGDGTFREEIRSDTIGGESPTALAAGDFNRDGRLDVATANKDSHDVSVLLSEEPQVTLRVGQVLKVGSEPLSIKTGDLDGDGLLDLATANFASDNVSVLPGNGDGTFRAQVERAGGEGPTSLVIADFDGNGRLDLAVAAWSTNDMQLLFFDPPEPIPEVEPNIGISLVPQQERILLAATTTPPVLENIEPGTTHGETTFGSSGDADIAAAEIIPPEVLDLPAGQVQIPTPRLPRVSPPTITLGVQDWDPGDVASDPTPPSDKGLDEPKPPPMTNAATSGEARSGGLGWLAIVGGLALAAPAAWFRLFRTRYSWFGCRKKTRSSRVSPGS